MEIRGLAFLPILWVTWMLLGLCVLLALTIIQGHTEYLYISDTGIYFPESVIYTFIFTVSSIVGAGIVYTQYKFMILQVESTERRYIIGQRILLAIGWIVCIGTAVNGFYSVETNATVHRISAGISFILHTIYNLCQAICLYKRSYSSRRMCHIRLAISLLTIVVLLTFAVGICGFYFHLCSGRCFHGLFMVGMVTEWVGVILLMTYHLTNFTDFQHLSLTFSQNGISISLREKHSDPENP